MALVTVLIPIYNAEDDLFSSLKSLKLQTFKNFKVIIIDDGSSTKVSDLVCVDDYPFEVKIIRISENKGRGYARSVGLEAVDTAYVAFLDSGDLYFPDKLERQIKQFESLPEIFGAVGVSLSFLGIADQYLGDYRISLKPGNQEPIESLTSSLPIPFAPTMIKTTLAKTIQFKKELKESEDFDFLVQVLMKQPFYIINKSYYAYSVNPSQFLKTIERRRNLKPKILSHLSKNKIPPANENKKYFLLSLLIKVITTLKMETFYFYIKNEFNENSKKTIRNTIDKINHL